MQYYFYHPAKGSLLVVAFLFEAKADNQMNGHMQTLIDEFQAIYDVNEEVCQQQDFDRERSSLNVALNSTIAGAAESVGRNESSIQIPADENGPLQRKLAKNNDKKGGIWDPFHTDIQKTIHFWGYTGMCLYSNFITTYLYTS